MNTGWSKFLLLAVLCFGFATANLGAQGATASTGSTPYNTSPGATSSYLDEYYFDVDFGSGTVTNCDLTINLSWTDAIATKVEIFVTDPLATMTGASTLPDYNFTIYLGYNTSVNPPVPAPVAGPGSTGGIIWGPNSGLYPGNFPLTGVVRFDVLITVSGASTFPNTLQYDFSTNVGSNVSTAGYQYPVGTNMGYNIWSQVAPTTAGLLQGYGRVGNCDYFQRNYSNVVEGVTRFGNASEEVQFFLDVEMGATASTLDIGLIGFAYAQAGGAAGGCVVELYDMQVGWDTPVATATANTSTPGIINGGYDNYTSGSHSGLIRFRVVMRGQGLTGVSYGATTFADFGFELYFSNNGQVLTLTTDPVLAAPRMAITPAGTSLTTSPTALTASGGTPTVTYNWSFTGTVPTGVGFNTAGTTTATGANVNLVFGATTPAGSTVTVRVTNGTGPEFAEETYTLNFGGGGGGNSLTIITTTLPNGSETVTYTTTNITATSTGTTGPTYTWSVSAGTIPPGLVLDTAATGLSTTISGTPTTAGTYNFTVQITDGTNSDTQAYQVDISAAGSLVITTASLPAGTQGVAYSANITAINGTGNHTWSITSGTLPTGLALGASTTGTVSISGTPTQTGTFPITVQVTDSTSPTAQTDTQAFSLVINAGSPPPTLGGGGGGGGGGGCAAAEGSSYWMLALGLLAVLGLGLRMRARRE